MIATIQGRAVDRKQWTELAQQALDSVNSVVPGGLRFAARTQCAGHWLLGLHLAQLEHQYNVM